MILVCDKLIFNFFSKLMENIHPYQKLGNFLVKNKGTGVNLDTLSYSFKDTILHQRHLWIILAMIDTLDKYQDTFSRKDFCTKLKLLLHEFKGMIYEGLDSKKIDIFETLFKWYEEKSVENIKKIISIYFQEVCGYNEFDPCE